MCLLICTFSGEMGYWDLGERERERAREKWRKEHTKVTVISSFKGYM